MRSKSPGENSLGKNSLRALEMLSHGQDFKAYKFSEPTGTSSAWNTSAF